MSIEPNWNLIGGVLLIVGGAVSYAGAWIVPRLQRLVRRVKPANPEWHSSDAPAPDGVADYLALVEETAAKDCKFDVLWEYARGEMTEATILRAELERKSGGKA